MVNYDFRLTRLRHGRLWALMYGLSMSIPLLLGFGPSSSIADAPSSFAPEERQYSGTASMTTAPFTLEDGWEVTWETESSSFQLSAYGVADLYEGAITETERVLRSFEVYEPIILANSTESSGTAFHPLGGTFYFKIIASGPWTIHLKPVKRTKDYLDVPYTGAP